MNDVHININIDPDINRLVNNLKVISDIKPSQKLFLNKKTKELSIDNGYFKSITRWMYHQNRYETIAEVDKTISDCIDLINQKKYINLFNKRIMNDAIQGITCLFGTYSDDDNISKIINDIRHKIIDIK